MDKAFMSISKVGKPFKVVKEMHLTIIQALINFYFKIGSYVVNLFASTSTCSSSKNSFTIFSSKNLFDHLSPCRQHCQGMPKPWAQVAMLEPNTKHVHDFDINSPIKKCFRRLLDYE
jgi:hypothetical protein